MLSFKIIPLPLTCLRLHGINPLSGALQFELFLYTLEVKGTEFALVFRVCELFNWSYWSVSHMFVLHV